MALRSHLDLAALGVTAGSGNWGYTSPGGRRLALMGTSAGLTVVDVTDPRSARITGAITGGSSAWREVKTYGEYAYVTTEAQTGLDIVDLHDPDRPARVRTWNETFASAHSVYIDQERGLLYANGTQSGMHVLDLKADPTNPREVGRFTDFYVHDCLRARQPALRGGDPQRVPGDARRHAARGRPRALALHDQRQLHPQRLADARRALRLHHRRARGLAARGLGPAGEPPRQGLGVHRRARYDPAQRDGRRRSAAGVALHRGRPHARRRRSHAPAAHGLLRHLSRQRRPASTAPGGPTSSPPRT